MGQQKSSINVIVLARQHPCENVSSFLCEELLNNLNSRVLNSGLKDIKWHVIPLVNLDGVELLNTRSNLLGYDINRCWAAHLFRYSAETAWISRYLRKIGLKSEDVVLDLHGHSREFDCFAYSTFKT